MGTNWLLKQVSLNWFRYSLVLKRGMHLQHDNVSVFVDGIHFEYLTLDFAERNSLLVPNYVPSVIYELEYFLAIGLVSFSY